LLRVKLTRSDIIVTDSDNKKYRLD